MTSPKPLTPPDHTSKEFWEIEKLKAETRQLKRPLLKRMPFWQFVVTSLLTLTSAYLLYINGAFDFKTKMLEYRRDKLEFEIRQFSLEKDSLDKANKALINRITKLVGDSIQLEKNVLQLRASASAISSSLAKRDKYVADLTVEKNELFSKLETLSQTMDSIEKVTRWNLSFQQQSIFGQDNGLLGKSKLANGPLGPIDKIVFNQQASDALLNSLRSSEEKVHICLDELAKAYHARPSCHALMACKGSIDYIPKSTAKTTYNRQPCAICF